MDARTGSFSLTDGERYIMAGARKVAALQGTDAICEYAETADPSAAYVVAFGAAQITILALLKIITGVPKPGKPQCEADGVRNGPDGPGGTEHYWSCTAPGTVDVDGTLLCEDHAGERGFGPKQEEYGFDPEAGQ